MNARAAGVEIGAWDWAEPAVPPEPVEEIATGGWELEMGSTGGEDAIVGGRSFAERFKFFAERLFMEKEKRRM